MFGKELWINSPQEFYLILKNTEYRNTKLNPFLDRMDLFLNGCPCDAEIYWEQTSLEYRKLHKINLDDLKSILKCDKINWYFEESFLNQS